MKLCFCPLCQSLSPPVQLTGVLLWVLSSFSSHWEELPGYLLAFTQPLKPPVTTNDSSPFNSSHTPSFCLPILRP